MHEERTAPNTTIFWSNYLSFFNTSLSSAAYMRQWTGFSIGSDDGLSPVWRQAIVWINAGILLIGPLETNLSEIRIKIQNFILMKINLNMSSGKLRPICPMCVCVCVCVGGGGGGGDQSESTYQEGGCLSV